MTSEEAHWAGLGPEDFYDDPNDEPYCCTCDGTGFIMTCPDDLCHGSGECIHGDGEAVCPDCKGRCAF